MTIIWKRDMWDYWHVRQEFWSDWESAGWIWQVILKNTGAGISPGRKKGAWISRKQAERSKTVLAVWKRWTEYDGLFPEVWRSGSDLYQSLVCDGYAYPESWWGRESYRPAGKRAYGLYRDRRRRLLFPYGADVGLRDFRSIGGLRGR